MKTHFIQSHALSVLVISVVTAGLILALAGTVQAQEKRRICVMTDISNEPDDQESLVRFLLYSNEMDVEGLIASTSVWKRNNPDTPAIHSVIDAYAQVVNNLNTHSPDKPYPTADYLHSITKTGVNGFAMSAVAGQLDNEGINHIISIVDKPDPRPIYITSWGGSNTLGGAIMKVRNTRTPAEAEAFVAKIRGYQIGQQDDGQAYIGHHYPDAFLIASLDQWKGISRTTPGFNAWSESWGGDQSFCTHEWHANHIQSHGPLGAKYPSAIYLWEGDTPSFLWVIPNGMNMPEYPHYGGWGGRFNSYKTMNPSSDNPDIQSELNKQKDFWLITDAADTWYYAAGNTTYTNNIYCTIFRWRDAFEWDFAARMDWTITPNYSGANHPPVPAFNGDLIQEVTAGDSISFSAAGSTDPDGNALSYNWMYYREPGSYNGNIAITNANNMNASFTIPLDAAPGTEIHIILSVKDNGTPNLTRYQRIIYNVVEVVIPKPTNLVATALSGSEVYLTWTDNSSGENQEDGFAIQRRPFGGINDWQQVGEVGTNVTSFSNTNNVHGMIEYTYRVGAFINN